jgi:biotin operon repressor
MSATAPVAGGATAETLTDKQQQILAYLRENADTQTYFKSRLIGDELDMSAKEVGTNMTALQEGNFDVDVEKWGYSSSTTWMVTA